MYRKRVRPGGDADQRALLELGNDGRYTRALGAAEGAVGDVPGCPGLTLELDELWAAVDRLQLEE